MKLECDEDYITIPINWRPTRYYKISFEGWGPLTISANDSNLDEIMRMAADSLNAFIKLYKDDRVFTEPMFGLLPDGRTYFKIGTLEKEEYERRLADQKETA